MLSQLIDLDTDSKFEEIIILLRWCLEGVMIELVDNEKSEDLTDIEGPVEEETEKVVRGSQEKGLHKGCS